LFERLYLVTSRKSFSY